MKIVSIHTRRKKLKNLKILHLLSMLWDVTNKCRRLQFIKVLILIIVSSLMEMVTIGTIVPLFSALLSQPTSAINNSRLTNLNNFIISNDFFRNIPIDVIVVSYIFIALLSAVFRVLVIYTVCQYSLDLGSDLSNKIYENTVNQGYNSFLKNNKSNHIITAVINKINIVIFDVIISSINLLNYVFLIVAISLTLLLINAKIAVISSISFISLYLIISYATKRRIQKNGEHIAGNIDRLTKLVQETIGEIRSIIIGNKQSIFVADFAFIDKKLRLAQSSNLFLSQSPRPVMETFGIVFIAAIAYFTINTASNEDQTMNLPLLAALALGGQKLLPLLQRSYWAWANILGSMNSLEDVLFQLKSKNVTKTQTSKNKLDFKNKIEFENISYKYPEGDQYIFKNLNLVIPRGIKLGIYGKTGGGKSTFVDIIMGLLSPNNGALTVDGVQIDSSNLSLWHAKIAHVPQSIFLSDKTILENIAFGVKVEDINIDQINEALRISSLTKYVESLPLGLNTIVGERGLNLSGGQRQRIGIARAFYEKSELIILDEATNALDVETEIEVIGNICKFSKDKTLIIITHRLEILKYCSSSIELDKLIAE